MSWRLYKITCTCRGIYTTNYIIIVKVTYFIRKLSTRNSSVQWRITWTPICIFESERVISARRECDTNFKLMSRRQFLRHSRFLTKRKEKKKRNTRAKSLTLEREPEYIFRACFHAWKIIVRRNLTLLLRHLSIESYVTLLNPDWLVAIFWDIVSRSTMQRYNAIFTRRGKRIPPWFDP